MDAVAFKKKWYIGYFAQISEMRRSELPVPALLVWVKTDFGYLLGQRFLFWAPIEVPTTCCLTLSTCDVSDTTLFIWGNSS